MTRETMKPATGKLCAVLLTAALMLACAVLALRAQPQTPIGTASDFSTCEYYNAPHEKQARFCINGAEAQPQPGGRYLIKQLKIEAFRVTGERELVVEAPECLYDTAQGQASSSGRLQVQSGDGRFSVAGEGFLWQQGEGFLTISNQVRSVIQRALTNAATDSPLVITSRWFSFETTNRSAIFHEDVRGDDPEVEFTCGQLAVHAGPESQQQDRSFEVIEADQALVITGKADGRRATADRGVYTRTDERVELIGNVNWQQGLQSGRADRAVVHRLENDVRADGRVAMKLPRESLGAGGALLGGTNAPVATDKNLLVDLFADQFHSRSNLTVAEGAVRLVDGTNRLSCDKLTVQSATVISPEETATAEGNVVLEQGGGNLRAARAVYTRSKASIVFTGEPKWTHAQMEGRAERVTIQTETAEIRAEDQVVVKLPLEAHRASFLTMFPAAADTNGTPQAVEIFAQTFTARERRALFSGNVRAHQLPATGSEPQLRSEELEVKFASASNQAESLQARKNVVYEQGLPGVTNGPAVYRKLTTHTLTARSDANTGVLLNLVAEGDVQIEQPGSQARGGRATYTAATDFLELTDHPSLETPQLIITDAQSLFWDKAKGRYTGTGMFKIKFKPAVVRQTGGKLKTP